MNLIQLNYDINTGFSLTLSPIIIILFIIASIIAFVIKQFVLKEGYSEFEIDEAEIGIGDNKIKIKPNDQDLQIAYQLWVELNTRKIGLAIDSEHDVIIEIYNSWYEFFKIARELIKNIPVRKFRKNNSTKAIVDLAFKILNLELRTHLTLWQAKFRQWYEIEQAKEENQNVTPQALQKQFPQYNELITDMLRINTILINYKNSLERMIK